MADLLAALRRNLEQARYDATEAREQGWDDAAVIDEDRAAWLEDRIDTLEHADGLAYGPPTLGVVA